MRAIRFDEYGDYDVLRVVDVDWLCLRLAQLADFVVSRAS